MAFNRNLAIACVLCVFALIVVFVLPLTKKQQAVNVQKLSFNDKGLMVLNGQLFSGKAVDYYPDGTLSAADFYVDGRRSGSSKKWFKGGQLAFQAIYINGEREGLATSWWFNGNKRSQTFFVNGKANGESWQYYRSGEKYKKQNFVNGQPVGMQQSWRENGKLLSNFEYKQGRIYGIRKANTCVGLENEKISVSYYQNQANNS